MRGWRRGGRKEAENFQNPTDQMRVIEVRVKEDLDRIDNAKLHVTQFRCGAYKQQIFMCDEFCQANFTSL